MGNLQPSPKEGKILPLPPSMDAVHRLNVGGHSLQVAHLCSRYSRPHCESSVYEEEMCRTSHLYCKDPTHGEPVENSE